MSGPEVKRESPKRSDPIRILRTGSAPYQTIWELQKGIQQELMNGTGKDTLILCEHSPVITVGRSARQGNILSPLQILKSRGVEVLHVERGGDVTYHGPGQLVAYPILDLKKKRRDVHWYMRTLEEAIIRTLGEFNLETQRIEGRTGVWTSNSGQDYTDPASEAKIASIGVRISRWCTLHGVAINVCDMSSGFSLINPCGFTDIRVTSLEQEGIDTETEHVGEVFVNRFLEVFDYEGSEPNKARTPVGTRPDHSNTDRALSANAKPPVLEDC